MGYKFSDSQRNKLETIGDVIYDSTERDWSDPHRGTRGTRHELAIETMIGEVGIDKITPEDGEQYYITYSPNGAEISDKTNFEDAVKDLEQFIYDIRE